MMKSNKKHKNKRILALLFATCMISGAAASFVSCGDSSTSNKVDDSEVTVTEKDDARIKNGNFTFFDDNDGKNLIVTSVTGWERSTVSSPKGTATGSSSLSGIVDTSAEKWETFEKTSSLAHATAEEAEANWDKLTIRDKLEFIEKWEDEDTDNDIKDLSFYDAEADIFNYNADFSDLPDCPNPGVPESATVKEDDTSVLMIHNATTDERGTAQKFTSSAAVTLQPGTAAKVSVWVNTSNLTVGGEDAMSYRGAFLGISQTVGGSALDDVQVKNINTNGEWKQYTFYVRASSYAETTFKLMLGLGQNDGTKFEYVQGYAFFDDIQCSIIKEAEYEALNTIDHTVYYDDLAADKILRADTDHKDDSVFAVDLGATISSVAWTGANFTVKETKEEKNGETFTSGLADANKDVLGYYTAAELAALANGTNATYNYYYNEVLSKDPFQKNTLLLFSATGAPYTADLTLNETIPAESAMVYSFWMKTSDLSGGYTGAGVEITDTTNTALNEETVLFTSINSDNATQVDVDGANGELVEDIYGGWQQCFVFVKNDYETARTFTLSFTYGPTTSISTTAKDAYRSGFVAFTNFESGTISEEQFKKITASSYSQTVTFSEGENADVSKFDSAAAIPTDAIETGFAAPASYSGVVGGSSYVVWNGQDCEKNAYEYAGLLRSEHVANYGNVLPAGSGVDLAAALSGATQPLFIYNNEKMSYGYIGTTQTITSGGYTAVGVRVKASVGAVANVYLIEKAEGGYIDALDVSTLKYTYWYDADGNVCSKDPTESDFDTRRDVAFKLNDQGLYEVNPLWSGYTKDMKGKLYANLQNYEVDEETGNLMVADGGVKYHYDSSVYEHAGNNGIAFYAKDKDSKEYYAYATKKADERVYDLASVAGLTRRYENNEKTAVLSTKVVGNASGEWVDCWFYIKGGNVEKSYRLEVWSGDRYGTETEKSEAGSFVVFDKIEWTLTEENYKNLLTEKLDNAKESYNSEEEFKADYENVVYSAFSWRDSPKFLRYDSTLDKDGVGDMYASHDATAYTESVVYFAYEESGKISKFVDYSVLDVEVTADSTGDNDADHGNDKPAETPVDGLNIWLLISSLAIAAVLVFAVVSIIVRKIVKKNRKPASVKAARIAAKKARQEEKESKKAAKTVETKEVKKDEKDPYND